MSLISIEDAIQEIRAGRMVILVDDEDRENEGDLTMAAQAVTPEAINFMAKYGRGLICLPMTHQRLVELALERIPQSATWRIADLGTGSGAIALALGRPGQDVAVTQFDWPIHRNAQFDLGEEAAGAVETVDQVRRQERERAQEYTERDRNDLATDLTWFVDLAGSHELKAGLEVSAVSALQGDAPGATRPSSQLLDERA